MDDYEVAADAAAPDDKAQIPPRRPGPAETAAILWDRLGGFPRPIMDDEPQKAQECSGYKPTQEELLVLARHWVETRIGVLRGHVIGRELQEDAYAATRLARIMVVLGEEAVRGVVRDVIEREGVEIEVNEGRDQAGAREDANRRWGERG